MPTNEERREVATRLRNIVGYCSRDIIEKIQETCGCNTGLVWEDVMEFKNRLADFIEPEPERTCKLAKVHEWNDEWEPFGYECESCGEGLPSYYGSDRFGMVITPNYCPNCGAKVVEK